MSFDVIKNAKYYDTEEKCSTCGEVAVRIFKPKIHLSGTKVEDAYYNPAFGQVIKSSQQAKEKAKELGMVEVGNERVEKHVQWTPKDYE